MQIHYSFLKDTDLGLNTGSDFLVDTLAAQWGSAAITQTSGLYILGVPEVLSIRAFNDKLPADLEFGSYVLNPFKGDSSKD